MRAAGAKILYLKKFFNMLNFICDPFNTQAPRRLMSKTPKYQVPALEHGLDLLELMLFSTQSMTQKEIATLAGKPVSTTFRLLNCLERRGYVQRDEQDSTYRPTLKLYGLGKLQPAYERFRHIASAPLRDLSRRIGESCHLSVLDDGMVRILLNQESPHTHSLNVRDGSQYSAVHTLAGKLLLAHLPEGRRRVLLESQDDMSAFTDAQQKEFWKELRALERKDFCVSPSQATPGVLDVDVLISGVWIDGDVVLAVPCLRKWNQREQKRVLLPTVREAAGRIAVIFGQSMGIQNDV